MPTPVLVTDANHLHQHVGSRVAVSVDGGQIPFQIASVRFEPERRLVIVDATVPVAGILTLFFDPEAIVEVQDAAA
jgi:hypothetical protein